MAELISMQPRLFATDGSLSFGSVQTMPFARPHFAEILSAIEFVKKIGFPARGEVETI